MDGAGSTPEEARGRLVERSVEDGAFRERLLADPKGTMEAELGGTLPDDLEIRVVEETPQTIYLVLPPRAAVREDGELSVRDLEAVAGGGGVAGETLPLCTVGEGCWTEL